MFGRIGASCSLRVRMVRPRWTTFRMERGAGRRASRGRSAPSRRVAVARPLHARTHERSAVLCRAGRDRRGDDGGNPSRASRARAMEFSGRRSGAPESGWQEFAVVGWQGPRQAAARPAVALAGTRGPGNAGLHGVHRVAGYRQTTSRKHAGGCSGHRCGRLGGRTDCQTQRLPGGRDRRRRRQVLLGGPETGLRCLPRSSRSGSGRET